MTEDRERINQLIKLATESPQAAVPGLSELLSAVCDGDTSQRSFEQRLTVAEAIQSIAFAEPSSTARHADELASGLETSLNYLQRLSTVDVIAANSNKLKTARQVPKYLAKTIQVATQSAAIEPVVRPLLRYIEETSLDPEPAYQSLNNIAQKSDGNISLTAETISRLETALQGSLRQSITALKLINRVDETTAKTVIANINLTNITSHLTTGDGERTGVAALALMLLSEKGDTNAVRSSIEIGTLNQILGDSKHPGKSRVAVVELILQLLKAQPREAVVAEIDLAGLFKIFRSPDEDPRVRSQIGSLFTTVSQVGHLDAIRNTVEFKQTYTIFRSRSEPPKVRFAAGQFLETLAESGAGESVVKAINVRELYQIYNNENEPTQIRALGASIITSTPPPGQAATLWEEIEPNPLYTEVFSTEQHSILRANAAWLFAWLARGGFVSEVGELVEVERIAALVPNESNHSMLRASAVTLLDRLYEFGGGKVNKFDRYAEFDVFGIEGAIDIEEYIDVLVDRSTPLILRANLIGLIGTFAESGPPSLLSSFTHYEQFWTLVADEDTFPPIRENAARTLAGVAQKGQADRVREAVELEHLVAIGATDSLLPKLRTNAVRILYGLAINGYAADVAAAVSLDRLAEIIDRSDTPQMLRANATGILWQITEAGLVEEALDPIAPTETFELLLDQSEPPDLRSNAGLLLAAIAAGSRIGVQTRRALQPEIDGRPDKIADIVDLGRLESIVGDTDAPFNVRIAAAKLLTALAQNGYGSDVATFTSVHEFGAILQDSSEPDIVRDDIARMLGSLLPDESPRKVTDAIGIDGLQSIANNSDAHPQLRASVVSLLGTLADHGESVSISVAVDTEQVRREVRDPDRPPEVRMSLLLLIGTLGHAGEWSGTEQEANIEVLVDLLEGVDEPTGIKANAIGALGDIAFGGGAAAVEDHLDLTTPVELLLDSSLPTGIRIHSAWLFGGVAMGGEVDTVTDAVDIADLWALLQDDSEPPLVRAATALLVRDLVDAGAEDEIQATIDEVNLHELILASESPAIVRDRITEVLYRLTGGEGEQAPLEGEELVSPQFPPQSVIGKTQKDSDEDRERSIGRIASSMDLHMTADLICTPTRSDQIRQRAVQIMASLVINGRIADIADAINPDELWPVVVDGTEPTKIRALTAYLLALLAEREPETATEIAACLDTDSVEEIIASPDQPVRVRSRLLFLAGILLYVDEEWSGLSLDAVQEILEQPPTDGLCLAGLVYCINLCETEETSSVAEIFSPEVLEDRLRNENEAIKKLAGWVLWYLTAGGTPDFGQKACHELQYALTEAQSPDHARPHLWTVAETITQRPSATDDVIGNLLSEYEAHKFNNTYTQWPLSLSDTAIVARACQAVAETSPESLAGHTEMIEAMLTDPIAASYALDCLIRIPARASLPSAQN